MLHRRTFRLTSILLCFLVALSCNNPKTKKIEEIGSEFNKEANDKPVSKKKVITGEKEFKTCEELITEILTTSRRYKEVTKELSKAVIKNGGLSFETKLEGSPNSKQDKKRMYSRTYDFTVYEIYTDRQLNTASFSFNPDNKQLYEYDVVNDKLNPIEFNRDILLSYGALCE
jgi:hypothetical protein